MQEFELVPDVIYGRLVKAPAVAWTVVIEGGFLVLKAEAAAAV